MSKVGKKPVPVPKGVTVTLDPRKVTVKGPKGTLHRPIPDAVRVKQATTDGELNIHVERADMSKQSAISYATMRSHIANMIKGVTVGFQKTMILEGVGYRAQGGKKSVQMSLGFSHQIDHPLREGVTVETPEPTKLIVSGADIEAVGQVCAELRRYRPPEPYKGKGMRYEGEKIRRKAGKAAGK
ncbi:MAG: 50S ribosomal protein L6 [Candidatus Hydrogenedentota bacterium]